VSFYQKYRVPIVITTSIVTSVVVAFALDKIMKSRKLKKDEKIINDRIITDDDISKFLAKYE
jgi:hypothetical protein